MSAMNLKSVLKYELGGEARNLRLDMNVLCDLEEQLGVAIMSNQDFWENMGFKEMRMFVWCMLYDVSPRPSLSTVGKWMSDIDFTDLMNQITKTWTQDIEKSKSDSNEPSADPTKD